MTDLHPDSFSSLEPLLHIVPPLTRPPTDLLRALSSLAKDAANFSAIVNQQSGTVSLRSDDFDWLDSQGVFIWNRSGEWRAEEKEQGPSAVWKTEICAACTSFIGQSLLLFDS